ncbi:peptidase [Xenorhabdus vietnamensis]|uniref:Peptidase n=1 Tax=Xenorhabdus vietnamensis TaxID=351656 RepID=A0A1Y2S631_9GAMM|nr:hypothetical protein [Xenorhabdus vietnamensis]OTA14065.1 peptidase [Xenorhabdus vietnamensis]
MKLNTQYLAFGYLAVLSALVWFGYGKYQDKAEEYARLKLVYDRQVAITDNAYHSIRLFNDIS